MNIFFVITGIILISATFKNFITYIQKENRDNAAGEVNNKESLERKLEYISAKIDGLAENISDISPENTSNSEKNESTTYKMPQKDFQKQISEQLNKQEYKKIFEEYQKGISITEIARKFDRGKGEIQLILNLKR